jgi:4-hydroxybenzoate polyprenyltransferase
VNNEVAKQTGKGLLAVVGAVASAFTLNQLVALATLVYIALQAAYLARKWWREEQEASKP